jgi:hypothetical protein
LSVSAEENDCSGEGFFLYLTIPLSFSINNH